MDNGHEDGKDTSKDSITGSALDGSVTIRVQVERLFLIHMTD